YGLRWSECQSFSTLSASCKRRRQHGSQTSDSMNQIRLQSLAACVVFVGGCAYPALPPPGNSSAISASRPAPPAGIDSFSGPYRFLSNFWPAEVEFEGIAYPSVEHAYQS